MDTTPPSTADAIDPADELVERYLPLATRLARRHARGVPWAVDDCISDATLALLHLARQHVRKPVAEFAAVLTIAVRRACHQRIRRELRRRRAADSVLAPVAADAPKSSEDVEQENADLARIFQWMETHLSETDSEILLRMLTEGALLSEVAAEVGRHLTSVSTKLWRAIQKLRRLAGVPERRGNEDVKQIRGVSKESRARMSAAWARRRGDGDRAKQ